MIDGKAVAAKIRGGVAEAAARLRNEVSLTLASPRSSSGTIRQAKSMCEARAGLALAPDLPRSRLSLPAEISEAALIAEVEKLNAR